MDNNSQVFSIIDLSWNIAFKDDTYTILSACWTSDSKHILYLGESGMVTCVWSIHSNIVY